LERRASTTSAEAAFNAVYECGAAASRARLRGEREGVDTMGLLGGGRYLGDDDESPKIRCSVSSSPAEVESAG
jgi:hypothetical protein